MEFKYKVGDTVRLSLPTARDAGLLCQYVLLTKLHDDYGQPAYSAMVSYDTNVRAEPWQPKFYESSIEGKRHE